MKAYRSKNMKKILADEIGRKSLQDFLESNKQDGIIHMYDNTKYRVRFVPTNVDCSDSRWYS